MNTRICLFASAIAMSFAANAYAEKTGVGAIELSDTTISVSGIGHHRTFPCNGRKLEVSGSGHVISTTGECSYVEVTGADSAVDVTIAPKGTLEVAGSNHKVRWKAAGEIKQDISGVDHKIVRVK
jgi:hypothetical protein